MFNDEEKEVIKQVIDRINGGARLPTKLLYPLLETKVKLYYSINHIQSELEKLDLNISANNISVILYANRKRNKVAQKTSLPEAFQKEKSIDILTARIEETKIEEVSKTTESLSQLTARLEMETRNKRNGFDQFDKLKKKKVDNPAN